MDNPKGIPISKMTLFPLYVFLAIGVILFTMWLYGRDSGKKEMPEEHHKIEDVNPKDAPLALNKVGSGIAGANQPAPEPKEEKKPEPIIVVKNIEPQRTNEEDELRRQRHQAALTALSSPLIVKKTKTEVSGKPVEGEISPQEEPGRRRGEAQLGDLGKEGGYSPAADKDKEGFISRSQKSDNWRSPYSRKDGEPYELKTGSVIPAAMLGGINSDLPGQIIAQVSQNVYDSANGRHLLIPQGTKLFGVYDSRIIYGQERILVAWNRLIFPDGSSFTLGSMPGTDSAGYSGFNDEVDNHYFKIYSNALLMTLITGGMAWSVDSTTQHRSSTNNNNNNQTLQQQMTSALANQLGQATSNVLTKGMNIKPTLEIRPGYRFNVMVTQDLVFKEPYLPKGK